MINTLLELTKGEYSGNIEELKNFVVDGKDTVFQELISDCTSFHYNGTELLIYKNNHIVYSGNITEYCEHRFVTSMYGKSGLVYSVPLNYDSGIIKCLEKLYNIDNPKEFGKALTELYTKYGTDTVTTARWLFDY